MMNNLVTEKNESRSYLNHLVYIGVQQTCVSECKALQYCSHLMQSNGICLTAEKLGRDLESSELRAVLNISGTSCYSPSAMSLFRA